MPERIDAGDDGGVPARNVDTVREEHQILTLKVNAKLATLQAAVVNEVNREQYEVLNAQTIEALDMLGLPLFATIQKTLKENVG